MSGFPLFPQVAIGGRLGVRDRPVKGKVSPMNMGLTLPKVRDTFPAHVLAPEGSLSLWAAVLDPDLVPPLQSPPRRPLGWQLPDYENRTLASSPYVDDREV